MKKINLLPKDELQKRGFRKYYKYIIIVIIVFLLLAGLMRYNIIALEKEQSEIEDNIFKVTKLEKQIDNKKDDIINLTSSLYELKYDNIPLNDLVYFISKETPENVQLIQVVSSTVLDKEQKELEGEDNSESIEDEKGKKADDKSKTVDNSKSTEKETDVNTEDDLSEEENTDLNKETKDYSNGDYLVLRGIALEFGDISDLVLKLDDLDYLGDVTIDSLENYYNGFNNYNVFEIKAEISYK